MKELRFFHFPWTCSSHHPFPPSSFYSQTSHTGGWRERWRARREPSQESHRMGHGQVLPQWFLKCDLRTCSISVTWGLVKNAGSWAHPVLPEEETLGVGHPSEKTSSWLPCNLNFGKRCITERSSEMWARDPHWPSCVGSSLFPSLPPQSCAVLLLSPAVHWECREWTGPPSPLPVLSWALVPGKSPWPGKVLASVLASSS